jgi:hypothetical protein
MSLIFDILCKVKKRFFKKASASLSAALAVFFLPLLASAHEVYVLGASEIAKDISYPPINLFAVAISHEYQFLTAGLVGVLIVGSVFVISILHSLGRRIDPFLIRIKPYAGHIAQITLGAALIASAYYGALFGIELPIANLFGSSAGIAIAALYIAGASLLLGIYPRIGALIVMALYVLAAKEKGIYMLSYLTYLGESLILLLFGGGYALFRYEPAFWKAVRRGFAAIEKRKHLIMRICFGTALIFAALYAKLIHGQLALDTVTKYHLTDYFPFDPLFIVLGAFLVEMSIGIFFLIGFEIRFTALFFLAFLIMSLVFFGESVWPHIILIGTALSLFVHGYDEYTVEKLWYTKGKKEPVL